jgi:hypothetical protein
MTEKETVRIVTLIVMSYPASEKLKDEETLKGMIGIWKTMFKDDDAQAVEFAVQKHVATNKWPPSIAEIREQMAMFLHPEIIPPDIAWAAVKDLLVSESEFSEPDLYKSFPPQVARVVETIGWSTLRELHKGHYSGNKDGMDRVAFMDLYKPVYARDMEQAMLPQALKTARDKRLSAEPLAQLEAAREQRETKERENKEFYERLGG